MKASSIWVVRHGPTTANAADIHAGWLDYTLTREGLEACRQVRDGFWRGRRVDHVAASPLRRTRDTATILFDRCDRLDPLWVEVAMAGYEGETYSRAHERFPHLLGSNGWLNLSRLDEAGRASLQASPGHVAADESPLEFLERIEIAIDRTFRYTPVGSTTAVVTHGAAVLAALHLAGEYLAAPPGNLAAALLRKESAEKKFRIVEFFAGV